MYKSCVVLLIVTTTLAFPQKKKGNLDDLIEDIFGPQNNKTTSTTEVNLDADLDKIFGSDASKKPLVTSTTPDYQKVEIGIECVIFNRPGVCVKYYHCENPSFNDQTSDGIDIAASYNGCESYLDVCCQKNSILASKPQV